MSVEFTIRPMKAHDEDRLREITALSFSRFMGFFAVQSILSEEREVLVSEVQGTAVGFVNLINFQIAGVRYGCILWIAVHPKFRRKGTANALIAEGVSSLEKGGAKALFASVQRRKKGAQIVLELNGFHRAAFMELWRIFGLRILKFYGDIWLAPGEVILIRNKQA